MIHIRLITLDFRSDITRLTEDFTGRDWLFEKIDNWLHNTNQRFFILTGEPGSGKSAIAARLTQVRPDNILAYHFCIAGRNNTVVPGSVLRSLAAQLADTLPDYGLALANTINPAQLRIEVNINVKTMTGGQITGVVIENLKPTDPETEIDILIRAPLTTMPSPDKPCFILIDSLDEAVTHRGQVNLVDLLAEVDDFPAWVRFLCTSRPEESVSSYFYDLDPYWLEAGSQDNLADIKTYIDRRLGTEALTAHLQAASLAPETLTAHLAELADGNFLYVTVLLDDIEAGRQPLDNLASLPTGIDDIYHHFLLRIRREWKRYYKPLFSILAVAQQPLTEDHLVQFTGLSRGQVRDNLDGMLQFLIQTQDSSQGAAYTLFHHSLREYVLDGDRNRHFWCDPQDCHALITNYYLHRYQDRWHEARGDGYLFDNLVYHLAALATDNLDADLALETLFAGQAWLQARFNNDNYGYEGFLADLALAWATAVPSTGAERPAQSPLTMWPCLVHYALLQATVHSMVYNIPPALLAQLVKTGLWTPDRALGLAGQESRPEVRVDHYRLLLETGQLSEAQAQTATDGLETARGLLGEKSRPPGLMEIPVPGSPAWNLNDTTLKALEMALQTVLADPDAKRRYIYQQVPDEEYEAYLKSLTEHDLKYHDNPLQGLLSKPKPPQVSNPFEAALDQARETATQESLALIKIVPQATPNGFVARLRLWEVMFAQTMALAFTPHLAGRHSAEAVVQTMSLEQGPSRLLALAALAPHVTGDHVEQILSAILTVEVVNLRNDLLSKLAPRLKGTILSRMVRRLNTIHEDEADRLDLLATLISHLAGDAQQRALDLVIQLARTPSPRNTAALARLVHLLPPDVHQRALDQAQTELSESHINSLADLLPTLPPEARREIARRTVERPFDEERETYLAPVLIKLGFFLDDDDFIHWLEWANFRDSETKAAIIDQLRSVRTDSERTIARTAGLLEVVLGRRTPALIVDGLATLASRLTGEQASQTMPIVDQMDDLAAQTQARLILTACLPQTEQVPYLEAALETVPTLNDPGQANVLGMLGQYHPDWALTQTGRLLPLLIDLLHRAALRGRPGLMARLTQLHPLWHVLTSPDTNEDIAQSLFDICWDWDWP
jgi:hypothetical protein